MRKIMLLCTVLIVSGCYSAKIQSYTVKSPSFYLCDDGRNNVFVKPLEYWGGDYLNYGEYYAEELKWALNNNRRGMVQNVECFNPWITTKLYNVVEDENEADIVIYGEYSTEYDSGRSERRCEKVIETVEERKVESDDDEESDDEDSEKEEEVEIIVTTETIVYWEYEAWQRVDLYGRVRVAYTHGDRKPWYYSISDYKKETDVRIDEASVLSSPSYMYNTLGSSVIRNNQYDFTPRLEKMEYVFSKVKAKNRPNRRLFRMFNSWVKDYCVDGKVDELGKLYLNMLTLEGNDKLYRNMGLCYELIGNYPKAKQYYLMMSNSEKELPRIERLIKIRDKMKLTGLEILEYDFY